ncbi:undecaprenol kinase [Bacillus mesophilus]|uniref:Diacylglycerol kinase family protein n=1 Tax=Bacillus mesophilus TaxID=1808955 RepID=A0A6M0Q5L7_9BACI|nr:diacylglycerol kinase family protein [Bacillus mesophilus]MBM7660797.1 undecaprenol kinase [Bacillus mesophilus]NEY71656.1 diacylglycerol kinase family protein [Bacillus mesophilus]
MIRDWGRLIRSFKYASAGILHAFKSEQNIRIHTISVVVIFGIAVILDANRWEWMILLILVGGIISLELINTAIERTIDLVTNKEIHPLAKQAKDVAAGAVLIFAVISVIIGIIIFYDNFLSFLNFLTI